MLSASTEAHDRGEKFAHYRTLGSLTDYLLVAQTLPRIEDFHRQAGGAWRHAAAEGLMASLVIGTLGCTLQLSEVYERLVFTATGSPMERRE